MTQSKWRRGVCMEYAWVFARHLEACNSIFAKYERTIAGKAAPILAAARLPSTRGALTF
jgi:hypothetical protein